MNKFQSLKKIIVLNQWFFGGRIFTFLDLKNMILKYSNDFVEIMFPLNENIEWHACILNWTQLIEFNSNSIQSNSKLNYKLLHITNDDQITLEICIDDVKVKFHLNENIEWHCMQHGLNLNWIQILKIN